MKALRQFLASMAGRVFLILWIGMIAAALFATLVAAHKRQHEFIEQHQLRSADRLQDYVNLVDQSDTELRQDLLGRTGPGIRPIDSPIQDTWLRADPLFEKELRTRAGVLSSARVVLAPPQVCAADFDPVLQRNLLPFLEKRQTGESKSPSSGVILFPTCRLIELQLSDGQTLRLSFDTPMLVLDSTRLLDPLFLTLLIVATGLLAYLVARMAGAPLKRLSRAATRLGHDLDAEPVAEIGPLEVRNAAHAFNTMQERLQSHLRERTHMLAAITHDLQTPLTRLRLRLEKVEDEDLRTRLIGDLAAMQAMIREGLDLARSAETTEAMMPVDLDSLLESLAEDAVDTGADVRCGSASGLTLVLRPLAARRLFSNLIDNAIKYAGAVEISVETGDAGLFVHVRDRGPGIPEDRLESMFEPFVRLEDSRSRQTGGAGLGLTIARMLATRNGATLTLKNRGTGGLLATVHWATPDIR